MPECLDENFHNLNNLLELLRDPYYYIKNYLIKRLRVFPAVNPGNLWPAIFIEDPVWGFLPVLVVLDRTLNVPNPETTTLSPLDSASRILPNTALTDSNAAFLVRPTFFATLSTKSFLVIRII